MPTRSLIMLMPCAAKDTRCRDAAPPMIDAHDDNITPDVDFS